MTTLNSRRERTLNAVIAAFTLLALPALVVIAGWLLVSAVFGGGSPPDCDDYTFDAEAWNERHSDPREEQAAALAECKTLVGMPRSEVAQLLGDTNAQYQRQPPRWVFAAGWVNDGIGPGDAQTLRVSYDETGRVMSAGVAYPPRDY